MTESWEHTRADHRSRQAASIATSALSLLTEHGGPALTMAAIADHADVSRQTLYRYFKDVDDVLLGVAELVTSHDGAFAKKVAEQSDPSSQLDLIVETAIGHGHADQSTTALLAVLPPAGRKIIAQHHARACGLLAQVLQEGIDHGTFDREVDPQADAPLILGLLNAADPEAPERTAVLVRRLVKTQQKEPKK